jgi:hypothetical protein
LVKTPFSSTTAFEPHISSDLSGDRLKPPNSIEKREAANGPHRHYLPCGSHDAGGGFYYAGQGSTDGAD